MGRRIREGFLALIAAYALIGCGGGGSSSAPATVPTVTLTSASADIAVNGSDTLTWSSTNATSCTASGSWSGSLATSGSQNVTVTQNSSYAIACTGAGGAANASTAVNAWRGPTATISADNTAVLPNGGVTLTWSSQNAQSCTGSGGLSGSIATSGTQTIAALPATTTFTIACANPVFAAAIASVTVTVSATISVAVTVQYQAPGPPVVNSARTYYVPDWAHPLVKPVPFVYVELDNAAGRLVQSTWADANGVAQFAGLDPTLTYTPVVASRIKYAPLGIDFVVLNNTAALDTSQGTFRARYPAYSETAAAFIPAGTLAHQAVTITIPDGWDAPSASLIDANRAAGPYELLAFAALEAQIVSAAAGSSAQNWQPLTILWSVKNKGGLSAPPNVFDQGIVTDSGGFWSSGHAAIDVNGKATGAQQIAENFIYVSGDQTFEAMEIYPFIMAHEMGHFSQNQFSTLVQPGGSHGFTDYQDPLLAWIEGNASGIAALVLNTPQQLRLGYVTGQIVVTIEDSFRNTVNGQAQSWPVGWYQEATTTGIMWGIYDPNGTIGLTAAATLAPMFSSAWRQGPWLNTIWAYLTLLKQNNPGAADAIDSLSMPRNVVSAGNDVWGTTETHPGNRAAADVLPPYTDVSAGQTISVCSVGAPLEFNNSGNTRLLRLLGNGATRTLTVHGPAGTVPVINGQFNPASATVSASLVVPSQGFVEALGDCAVTQGEFTSDTAVCSEPAVPPAEQCWSVALQ